MAKQIILFVVCLYWIILSNIYYKNDLVVHIKPKIPTASYAYKLYGGIDLGEAYLCGNNNRYYCLDLSKKKNKSIKIVDYTDGYIVGCPYDLGDMRNYKNLIDYTNKIYLDSVKVPNHLVIDKIEIIQQ